MMLKKALVLSFAVTLTAMAAIDIPKWAQRAGGASEGGGAVTVGIHLETITENVSVGDTVTVPVYAKAQGADSMQYTTIEMVVLWDPSRLILNGNNQTGALPTLIIGTGYWDQTGDLGVINESNPPADGNGWLSLHGPLGVRNTATADGVLISTLEFTAISDGMTTIAIGDEFPVREDRNLKTSVYSAVIPGLTITGDRVPTTVTVGDQPAPSTCGELVEAIRMVVLNGNGEATTTDNAIVQLLLAYEELNP